MKLTLGLIACIGALVGTQIPDKGITPYVVPAQQAICDYTQWEGCHDVLQVTVITTDLLNVAMWGRANGLYLQNEPYVFLVPGLTPRQRRSTEIHETVHYLQNELGLRTSKCQTENDARFIAAVLSDIEYAHDWPLWYNCTKGEDYNVKQDI